MNYAKYGAIFGEHIKELKYIELHLPINAEYNDFVSLWLTNNLLHTREYFASFVFNKKFYVVNANLISTVYNFPSLHHLFQCENKMFLASVKYATPSLVNCVGFNKNAALASHWLSVNVINTEQSNWLGHD